MKKKLRERLLGWTGLYRNSFFLQKLSSLLAVDILAKLFSVLLLPVYLWVMTQEEYGIYNYILSIITTFSIVLNFGLYVSQSKYYSDAHSQKRKGTVLFNIFLLIVFFLAIIIGVVYGTGMDYKLVKILFRNNINYPAYRWLILLGMIVTVFTLIMTNFFVTSEKVRHFRRYNMYKLVIVNLAVITALFLYTTDKIQIRLLYTYVAELLMLSIFAVSYIREMNLKIDKTIMISSLRLGLPIMFSAIWSLFSNYSDKFFLEKYGTANDLSYYYLAFSITNILNMICTAFQNAWLPTFLKEKDLLKNIGNTKKLIGKLFVLLSVLSLALILGLLFALKTNIISPKYWPTIYVLPILLFAQVLNGILMLYSNYLIYFEKTHWGFFVGIFTSLIGLVCSLIFIPKWNIYGAATVYLLVQLTYLTTYHILIRNKLNTLILQSNNPGTNA